MGGRILPPTHTVLRLFVVFCCGCVLMVFGLVSTVGLCRGAKKTKTRMTSHTPPSLRCKMLCQLAVSHVYTVGIKTNFGFWAVWDSGPYKYHWLAATGGTKREIQAKFPHSSQIPNPTNAIGWLPMGFAPPTQRCSRVQAAAAATYKKQQQQTNQD